MSTEIQRTHAESFRLQYGYDWPHEHRPCTGALPEFGIEDQGEFYYKVAKYRELVGVPDKAFMARLRDALEVMDEAKSLVEAFEPEQSYDEALEEYEAEYLRWR